MNSIVSLFNQASLSDFVTFTASFVVARAAAPILGHWSMSAYKYAMGEKRKLSADQVIAREAAENIVFDGIHAIEGDEDAPDYIYLETADRLFFGNKDDDGKYKIYVLNMESKHSHYLQTKMKYMPPEEALEFIKNATDPNHDFDAHAYIPKEDEEAGLSQRQLKYAESFYRKHAKMRCSKIRLKMDEPDIIENSAKEAASSLKQMVTKGIDSNRSSGNTVKLFMNKREGYPSMFFHKPFAENLRGLIEQAVNVNRKNATAVHFREFAPKKLLDTIFNARLFMRDQYIGKKAELTYTPEEPVPEAA